MKGKTEERYLVAMAVARPVSRDKQPVAALFAERLRTLVLVRALEAARADVPRERHLEAACINLRHAADREFSPDWNWINLICHPENAGMEDFVSTTLFHAEGALAASPEEKVGEALRHLKAVVDGKLVALRSKNEKDNVERTTSLTDQVHVPPAPARTPFALSADAGNLASIADESGEEHVYLVSEVDPKRPPRAQKAEGTGLILQSLEEAQFLRQSWHRLGRHEVQAFLHRLSELQNSSELQDRLGSALVGIAAIASVPLSRISRVRLQAELADDWTLNLKSGRLQRRPPRSSDRWRSGFDVKKWVQPLADEWGVELPQAAQATLRGLCKRGGISLEDLWNKVSPAVKLEAWFGQKFAIGPTLSRLTGPVVPTILGQNLFEVHHDHAESRLLTSSKRSAIPAASIYGSFRGDEVRKAWNRSLHPELGSMLMPMHDSTANAAGSEMDLDLARLRSAIARLRTQVNTAAADDAGWVEHHNLLTALCIVTLFASTGARPVNSPFESLRWFDFDRRLVYVEDKRSGPTQGARLCVLSDAAHDLITQRYLPHIKTLQQALATQVPTFSEQLRKVQDRDSDCRLPLFFFLRGKPNFDWIEISTAHLDIVCNHPWPLPWNLFRHLQSTYFRRKGLPADIRDALLSHGERGAESHGEFSWRTPCDDLELARPLVNLLAKDLGLALPRGSAPPHVTPAQLADLDFAHRPSFGRAAREARREKTVAAAKRSARAEIDRLLEERLPETLSADDWEPISRAMILRPDGIPHAMGLLRAGVLEDYLSQLWRDKRIRAGARRRYEPIEEGRACFNESVISAQRDIAELRIALDVATDGLARPAGTELAGCLAALELSLHCRVSNFRVLTAIVCNDPSVNVVRFLERYWLEFAYYGDWSDGRPVYRVPITARAAGWIASRQGARRLKVLPSTPAPLENFGGIRDNRFAVVLRHVCELVAQANALELPGVVAAVLRGSNESPALPHSDWVRIMHLQAPTLGKDDASDQSNGQPEDVEPFLSRLGNSSTTADVGDPTRCAALFDAIQATFNEPISTRKMAAVVKRLVAESGFGAGSAPFVLAHYVHHLLTRQKRTDKSKTLKADTVRRYWYALKPGILDHAYDIHMAALDDQELTELYQKIVEAAESLPDSPQVDRARARRRALKADTDAGRRARKELWDFHKFARDIYGLDDPEWSEISPGICAGFGRPGLVLMAEYEAVLTTLAGAGNCHALDDATLSSAFVLLACARFGLRIGEAAGVSYADWVEVSAATVVLVRSNRVRGLKTEASKRQVPLVGQLNALERAVIDEVRRRWLLSEDPGAVQTRLLPQSERMTFRAHKNQIAKRLLPLIKAATGNSASTVHHLRHGFACRLLALLHGSSCGMGLICDEESVRSTRRLLLEGDAPDRRTMWAVARMLGHTSPATTIKSYIHVLDHWLPQPPERSSLVHATSPGFVNVDGLPRADLISSLQPKVVAEAPEPLLRRYIQYLRLRASSVREARGVARLSTLEAQRLDDLLTEVAGRVAGRPDSATVDQVISRVREKRWRNLAALSQGVALPAPPTDASAWLPTIGASRQIVLFKPIHFDWMARFVGAMGFSKADCGLVHRSDADQALLQMASAPTLNKLLSSSADHGATFQLDRAIELAPKRVYPDRMVLIATPKGRLATSYELLLLWVAWLTTGQAFGATGQGPAREAALSEEAAQAY